MGASAQTRRVPRIGQSVSTANGIPTLKLPEQLPHVILLYSHMQVSAGDADVGMPCGISYFGKGPAACQGMADERMPTVVDREGA